MAERYGTGGEDVQGIIARFQAQKAVREELRATTARLTADTEALASATRSEQQVEAAAAGLTRDLAAARERLVGATAGQTRAERANAEAALQSAAAQEKLAGASRRASYGGRPGSWRATEPWTGAPGSWRPPGAQLPPAGIPPWMGPGGPTLPRRPAGLLGPGENMGATHQAAIEQNLYRDIGLGNVALAGRSRFVQQATAEMQQLTNAEMRHGALSSEWIMAAARGETSLRSLGSQLGITAAKFGGWVAAGAAVYGLFDVVKQLGTGAAESNNAIAQLSRFIEHGFDTDRAKKQLRDLSTDTNTSIKEAGEAAGQFARVFHNQDQAMAAAHAALVLHQLDNLSLADSYKALTAVVQGFHLSAKDIPGLMDSINASQREFGANVSQIVAGFGRASGAVSVSGGTPQPLQAMLATIIRSTGGQGANIGIAIGRAATRFSQQPANEAILKTYGITVGQGWDKLIESAVQQIQQRNLQRTDIRKIATAVGGPAFGARYFAGFFQNTELYNQIVKNTSPEAAKGTAQDELRKKMGSLGQEAHSVRVELQNLGSELEQVGAAAPIELLLTALTDTFKVTRGVVELFRELPAPIQASAAAMAGLVVGAKVLGAFTRAGGLASRLPLIGQYAGGGEEGRLARGALRGNVESRLGDVVGLASTQRAAAVTTERAGAVANAFRVQENSALLGAQGAEKQAVAQAELARLESQQAAAERALQGATEELTFARVKLTEAENLQAGFASQRTVEQQRAYLGGQGITTYGAPRGENVPVRTYGGGGIILPPGVTGAPAEDIAAATVSAQDTPRTIRGDLRNLGSSIKGTAQEGGILQRTFSRIGSAGERAAAGLGRVASGGLGGGGLLGFLGAVGFAASIGYTAGTIIADAINKGGAERDRLAAGPQTGPEANALFRRGRTLYNARIAARQDTAMGGWGDPQGPQIGSQRDEAAYAYYLQHRVDDRAVFRVLQERYKKYGYTPPPAPVGPLTGGPGDLLGGVGALGVNALGRTALNILHPAAAPKGDPTVVRWTADIRKDAKDVMAAYKSHHITWAHARKLLEDDLRDVPNAADYPADPKKAAIVKADTYRQITTMIANQAPDRKSLLQVFTEMDAKTFTERVQTDAQLTEALGASGKRLRDVSVGYTAALDQLKKDPGNQDALKKFQAAQTALQNTQTAIITQLGQALSGNVTPAQVTHAVDQAVAAAQKFPKGPQRNAALQAITQAALQGVQGLMNDLLVLAHSERARQAAYDTALREAAHLPGRAGRVARQQIQDQKAEEAQATADAWAQVAAGRASSPAEATRILLKRLGERLKYAIQRYGADSQQAAQLIAQQQQTHLQAAQDSLGSVQTLTNLRTSQLPSYDTVGRARAAYTGAQNALADVLAHRADYGPKFLDAYRQAVTAVNDSRTGLADAIRQDALDLAHARNEYLQSLTTDPIASDKLKIASDVIDLRSARTPTERYRALAQRNRDRQQLVTDRLSSREDDIQFQLDMHKISNQQAEDMYQNLLHMHGLTKQMRREIKRRIQSLKDAGQQEASGFGLDVGSIKMPTVYDVRRAMRAAIHGTPGPATPHATVHQQNRVEVFVTDPHAAHKVYEEIEKVMGGSVHAAMRTAGLA